MQTVADFYNPSIFDFGEQFKIDDLSEERASA